MATQEGVTQAKVVLSKLAPGNPLLAKIKIKGTPFDLKNCITYLQLINSDHIDEIYKATALPTFYVIGEDGQILYRGWIEEQKHLIEFLDQRVTAHGH
jgi:hypothetical protein